MELIDRNEPGMFNEAVMELGATICLKNRPSCLLCPVRSHCSASQTGNEAAIPVIVRKGSKQRAVNRLWFLQDGALLMQVHPQDASRLAGIAELPELPAVPPGAQLVMQKKRGISSEIITESVFALAAGDPLPDLVSGRSGIRMVPVNALAGLSVSAPHRRWIRELLEKDSYC